MHRGYIKLWRRSLETEVFSHGVDLFGFWCFLLLKANHKKAWFCGLEIQPGQFATSYGSLSDQTGISVKRCRSSLEALTFLEMIKRENRANRFTIISICKWDTYQSQSTEAGQTEGTTEGTTEGKLRANQGQQSKNDKNDKNEKNKYTPYYRISFLTYSIIKNDGSFMKEPNLFKWAEEVKKIHDIDKKPWDFINQTMQNAMRDSFWSKHLRSTKKLREHINNGNFDKFAPKTYRSDEQYLIDLAATLEKEATIGKL